MSIRSKSLIALAAFACVGALDVAPAGAASTQCAARCGSVFSRALGVYGNSGPVEAVLDGQARVGQPVILNTPSNMDPSEDIIPERRTVSAFYADGLVSTAVNARYGSLLAVQQQYAPFGIETGLCVGLDEAAHQNQGLTLQPCDVSARTVWILDFPDSPSTAPAYFPIVNASTTGFDRPFAMDLPRDELVNGRHTLQIHVRRLKFLGSERTLPDSQLWGFLSGTVG